MQNMQPVGLGLEPVYGYTPNYQQQPMQQYPQQMQMNMQQRRPAVNPAILNAPPVHITTSGEGTVKPTFTVVDEGKNDPNHSVPITYPLSDAEKQKKPVSRKKKTDKVDADTGIIKADSKSEGTLTGTVEDSPAIYTYNETNHLLHETLGQIDAINSELVQEFNIVRNSRTMKNKYNTLNALSENIGSLISNRINTIKEINNCISKANDLDYKRYKDFQAAQANVNDDKYIADVYQALIQNPQNQAPTFTANVDPAMMGSGIIRANLPGGMDMTNGQVLDAGYLNYISNLSPEQNLMRYENDPNVKQVLVYDAMTGNKFFQMMNMSTGEVIPNVPVYDESIAAETTPDLVHGIAKNLNLRENFPLIQINNNITSQY